MRISDWSSDVCSSDLLCGRRHQHHCRRAADLVAQSPKCIPDMARAGDCLLPCPPLCSGSRPEGCRQRRTHINGPLHRSEEHKSELQSLMRISYAGFCLKKKKKIQLTKPTLKTS